MSMDSVVNHELADLDTMPKILYRNFILYRDMVAMRKKNYGIWQEYTWENVYEHIKMICFGFSSLGANRGDRVVIIGNNDPELVWAQWGAQHAQLIVSCLYVDYLPDEVKFFMNDCTPKFVVCEDQEQVDKIIRIKHQCPSIEKVVYWDPKGLWSYEEEYLISLKQIEMLGRDYEKTDPKLFENKRSEIMPEDVAVIIYTSGTTGEPKGNMQTYKSLMEYGKEGISPLGLKRWDEYLSYASPAWAEQIVGLSICPLYPLVMSFAEEPETVMADLRDIGPHFIWFGGRQWEDLARQIRVGIEETSWWKRLLFKWALKIGYEKLQFRENGERVSFLLRTAHKLADFFVLRKVRDYFGMNRARCCGIGGALTSPDLQRFFQALGIGTSNLYGSVEAGMLTATHPLDTAYSSVGKVNPGKEIKIENGEILVKVGQERPGYWNKQWLWQEKVENGWYFTGDAGWIDDNGYLYYIDRISEMVTLKSGYRFSPQYIETRLRFNPYIKDAIVFGPDKEYIVAIVSCDFGMVGRWAESKHIPYTTLVEMSQLSPVLQLLREQIQEINTQLPPEMHMRKFASLHKEFDPDEAELTRSRKLKRTAISDKYSALLDAVYRGQSDFKVVTEVSYKDGRKANVSTVLKINVV